MKAMYNLFKKIIEESDASLICNVDYLVKTLTKLNYENIGWINMNQKRFDDSRFILDYSNQF